MGSYFELWARQQIRQREPKRERERESERRERERTASDKSYEENVWYVFPQFFFLRVTVSHHHHKSLFFFTIFMVVFMYAPTNNKKRGIALKTPHTSQERTHTHLHNYYMPGYIYEWVLGS